MNYLHQVRRTGILLIFFTLSINIPYILLIQNFEYDDILREPTDYVLTQFAAGGTKLILTWFCFGLLTLLFIPAVMLLGKIILARDAYYLKIATLMGVISSILQSIGLMRWAFVIPLLASLQVNPNSNEVTRTAVGVVYQAVHQYGGVVIGEYLGQTLLICWTIGMGKAMLESPLFKPWQAWWGLFTTPLLLLGQTELLATVIPKMPVIETTPIGFILWEIWLLMIGISLLRIPKQRLIE